MKTRNLVSCFIVFAVLAGAFGPLNQQSRAAGPGFGIMGDSGSDEYRADDNRGGVYAATTLNWNELLTTYKGFDFGAWGTRTSPRRIGYEYNWALSGATAHDIITGGQHTGLAQQVASGKVQYVLLMVGPNDFAIWNGTYNQIYSGSMSPAQIQAKVDGMVADIQLAVDTVLGAGPVHVVVANLADRGVTPFFMQNFPDAAKRQVVSNAIIAVNQGIQNIVATRNIKLLDLYGYQNIFLPLIDANGNLNIGGELISLVVNGDEPHHSMLADNEHAGTVGEGMLANYILDQWNSYGLNAPKFTDLENLNHAGIYPVVPDTTAPTVSLTNPVAGTVSGNVNVTANASDNVSVAGVQFKLDGINLGAEDTTAPYSVNWSTSTSTNSNHTITAVARDAAGNQATSVAVNVVVNNVVPDTTAPSVAITGPAANSSFGAGTSVVITASASDNVSVAGVQFKLDGTNLGAEDTSSPYSTTWNTSPSSLGSHALSAVARDAAGNIATSAPVAITVTDSTAPSVSMTAPANNAVVTGTVTVTANASDNVGVAGVQFKLNGANLGAEDTSAPYSTTWNTTGLVNGQYVLSAVARDAQGNTTTAPSRTVTISRPITYTPTAENLSNGTFVSGNIASLVNDDNNFYVNKSTTSGTPRIINEELAFTNVTGSISRLDYSVGVKSSVANTTVKIYAYNFATGIFTQIGSAVVGTGETTLSGAVTSGLTSYISGNMVGLRIASSQTTTTYNLSTEFAKLVVTP